MALPPSPGGRRGRAGAAHLPSAPAAPAEAAPRRSPSPASPQHCAGSGGDPRARALCAHRPHPPPSALDWGAAGSAARAGARFAVPFSLMCISGA